MSKQLTIEQVEQICKVSADGIKQIIETASQSIEMDVEVDIRREYYIGELLPRYKVRVKPIFSE